MAATKSNKIDETSMDNEELVEIRLPRREGDMGVQQEYFSVNDRSWNIIRGESVKVPKCLAEVIMNGQYAEEAALAYAQGQILKS